MMADRVSPDINIMLFIVESKFLGNNVYIFGAPKVRS